ncbi:alpha-protein kinase 1-like isoform X1 [Acanthaster planci]|uniref:Alpha-protein kinase 1-like isoform X1 n=1 Tax=Acanthaster planci TaxID=133434 RepID=A0A8B7YYH3_ACAPL|nr:alpha-protein kinase 1-like isoform X1 [Acanthaster planci]XP_022097541.1 alpha-protein kinase 1-like isoform X1 [Acanthaster planci]
MGSNQSNTTKVIGSTSEWVEFEDDWFSQGVSRYAYKGTFHGNARTEGERCVVKVYKDEYLVHLKDYAWKVDDRVYRKAREMAQLFNARYKPSTATEFVAPEFTKVDKRATFYFLGFIPFERNVKGKIAGTRDNVSNIIPANASIAVERFLEGDYVKYSSNTGYVNPDFPAPTLAAFSHFTYHASNGEFLVSDLQGVYNRQGFCLTDPAIQSGGSELNAHGPTDLGKYGIVKFFQTHNCNKLCKGLKKAKISKVTPGDKVVLDNVLQNMPSTQSSTTYTYQLNRKSGLPNDAVEHVQNNLTLDAVAECSETDEPGSDSNSDDQNENKWFKSLGGTIFRLWKLISWSR